MNNRTLSGGIINNRVKNKCRILWCLFAEYAVRVLQVVHYNRRIENNNNFWRTSSEERERVVIYPHTKCLSLAKSRPPQRLGARRRPRPRPRRPPRRPQPSKTNTQWRMSWERKFKNLLLISAKRITHKDKFLSRSCQRVMKVLKYQFQSVFNKGSPVSLLYG